MLSNEMLMLILPNVGCLQIKSNVNVINLIELPQHRFEFFLNVAWCQPSEFLVNDRTSFLSPFVVFLKALKFQTMDIIEITVDEIDVGHILSKIKNATSGATACFIGTTRDTFDGKKVVHLEYETYYSMAMKELHSVCEAMKRWPLTNVVLVHRIGTVPVTEVSVLVAASSVHRKEALEAVSYGIDAIKDNVPIWKKEKYDDGTYNWKENCVSK